MERLTRQIDFLLACDGLKRVVRQNQLHDGSRNENSAEHSWHLALMAFTLAEYAPPSTNAARVVELLVVHDLVEVYAGDAYFELPSAELAAHAVKEAQAADRLFGLLPADQARHFRACWDEFEARTTPEARFARALDALHPLLLTWGPGGWGSTYPELTPERVLRRKRETLGEFPELWALVERTVAEAVAAGIMPRNETANPSPG